MAVDKRDEEARNQLVEWVLKYAVNLIAIFAVFAVLLILSRGFTIGDSLLILSLLLIAGIAWAAVIALIRNQSTLEKQAILSESEHALKKKQQIQAQREFVQAERLYLIEKAQLQPVFTATARGFITPSDDFEAPDDVWDEDAFIARHFSEPDLFGIKLTFRQKGTVLFSHEKLIFDRAIKPKDRIGSGGNEAYVALDEKEKPVYIIPLDELPSGSESAEFFVYFIYKDLTTLSVVMKYRVFPAIKDDANFWSIENVDTCYANAYHEELALNSVVGCEDLFTQKYHNPLLKEAMLNDALESPSQEHQTTSQSAKSETDN